MLSIFMVAFPIFALILLGKILKHKFLKIDEFWRGCEKLTYYTLFPALLITTLSNTDFNLSMSTTIFTLIATTLVLAALLLLLQFFMRIEKKLFTSLFQGSIRYNSYIFIGLGAAFYGEKGIALVAIVIAYMIVLTNILSVLILDLYITENSSNILKMIKNIFKNPLILATIIGLILNPMHHVIPIIMTTFLNYLGNASLPLSLLSVGAGLQLQYVYNRWLPIFSASMLKLIVLPAGTYLALTFFGVNGLPKSIAVLYAAVPCAGNAYILAQQMGGDAEAMASIISMTTLLSILTIPFILAWTHLA